MWLLEIIQIGKFLFQFNRVGFLGSRFVFGLGEVKILKFLISENYYFS